MVRASAIFEPAPCDGPMMQRVLRCRRVRLTLCLAVALSGVLCAPALADVTGPEIIGFMNAKRAAHGIPAGITENPDWSRGCHLHNHYGAVNGELEHAEDPAKPGYTAEGDAAGRSSVLYGGYHWTADANPFEHAPIHLHQLLAPRIDVMGAYESEGRGCASTLRSFRRPAPASNVTYTYPAEGTQGWRPSEIASERPYTPGEKLGIPQGTRTGPYLYVMFDGPSSGGSAKVSSASLTGPSGAVDILTVDNTTPGLEGYLPTGAELDSTRAAGAIYVVYRARQRNRQRNPAYAPVVVYDGR